MVYPKLIGAPLPILPRYLHSEADAEVNMNLVNLMTYGQRIGWERIENRVAELLDFIRAAKEGGSDGFG